MTRRPERVIPARIHIVGASGSGTTTLAAHLAARHGHRHLDTDDFYWLPSQPRFQHVRPREERLAMLQRARGRRYDTGGLDIRSRALHEAWLAAVPCPVIRLEEDLPTAAQLGLIEASSHPSPR